MLTRNVLSAMQLLSRTNKNKAAGLGEVILSHQHGPGLTASPRPLTWNVLPASLSSIHYIRFGMRLAISFLLVHTCARRYCDRQCLLVRSLACYARCDFSNSISQIFMKFGTDVQRLRQISLFTSQGQSPRSRLEPPY